MSESLGTSLVVGENTENFMSLGRGPVCSIPRAPEDGYIFCQNYGFRFDSNIPPLMARHWKPYLRDVLVHGVDCLNVSVRCHQIRLLPSVVFCLIKFSHGCARGLNRLVNNLKEEARSWMEEPYVLDAFIDI